MVIKLTQRIIGGLILSCVFVLIFAFFKYHQEEKQPNGQNTQETVWKVDNDQFTQLKSSTQPAAQSSQAHVSSTPQAQDPRIVAFGSLQPAGEASSTTPAADTSDTTSSEVNPTAEDEEASSDHHSTTAQAPAVDADVTGSAAVPQTENMHSKIEQAQMSQLSHPNDFHKKVSAVSSTTVNSASSPHLNLARKFVIHSVAESLETSADQPVANKQLSLAQGWWIQLGSFANSANATKLQILLRSHGFIASISSGKSFKVLIGPEKDKSDAQATIAEIRQVLDLNPVLLPPSSNIGVAK